MTYPPPIDAERHWAPCVHSDRDNDNLQDWAHSTLELNDYPIRKNRDLGGTNSLLEETLWYVAHNGDWLGQFPFKVSFQFHADQWVGVHAIVVHSDNVENIWVEADTFTQAMVKIVEILKEKAEACFVKNPRLRTSSDGEEE